MKLVLLGSRGGFLSLFKKDPYSGTVSVISRHTLHDRVGRCDLLMPCLRSWQCERRPTDITRSLTLHLSKGTVGSEKSGRHPFQQLPQPWSRYRKCACTMSAQQREHTLESVGKANVSFEHLSVSALMVPSKNSGPKSFYCPAVSSAAECAS